MSAKPRKTVDVVKIVEDANKKLALLNVQATDDFRKGVISMLEVVLFATGNYHGYNYLGWCQEGGVERWIADGRPQDNSSYLGNEYRRVYYMAPNLAKDRELAYPKGMRG